MGRFLLCVTLAISLLPLPVLAEYPKKHTAFQKHQKQSVQKKALRQAKAYRKASPKHIISTIRSDRAYRSRAGEPRHAHGSESVFSTQSGELQLGSTKALIVNQNTGEVLYAKSIYVPTPIASLTKLMMAMVLLDQHLPMDEMITISESDVDTLKGTSSRLRVGTQLSRHDLLQLALMSSENRAASALARTTPQGMAAFVAAMNAKAAALGMKQTRFADPTGLNSENVSTAEDLVKLVKAAYEYPEIRAITTTPKYEVAINGFPRPMEYRNTNILVRNGEWDIGLSKTGFINEAGRCLVMQAQIAGQPLIIVLLDSWGKNTRIGDAQRIRKWVESSSGARKLG
ncbi:MAG: D-alanyl-D-alanine endopeptidase [Methylophilaceae bacterium]|nr:D-alanyl-D-alanine endopeptidase [Methylophilaceae bacterium]